MQYFFYKSTFFYYFVSAMAIVAKQLFYHFTTNCFEPCTVTLKHF